MTPYEKQQVGWVELLWLRKAGGAVEIYPIEFVLKFKRGEAPLANYTPVFAQDVPKTARKEDEQVTKELKNNKSDQARTGLKRAIELFPDY